MSHARTTTGYLLQYGAISQSAQTREWTKNSEEQLLATSSCQAPPRRGGDPRHISTHYTARIPSIVEPSHQEPQRLTLADTLHIRPLGKALTRGRSTQCFRAPPWFAVASATSLTPAPGYSPFDSSRPVLPLTRHGQATLPSANSRHNGVAERRAEAAGLLPATLAKAMPPTSRPLEPLVRGLASDLMFPACPIALLAACAPARDLARCGYRPGRVQSHLRCCGRRS